MEIMVNGIRINYVEAGKGITLLLVHGYPFDHSLWQPQFDGLQDVARVITPDLRGFGASDAPAGTYSMETQADDLRTLLAVHRIDQVVLGGLSMGGYIALAFWRRYPTRVRALILADTRAAADTPAGRQARLDSVEQIRQQGAVATLPMLDRLLSESTRRSRPEVVETVRAMMLRQKPQGLIGAQLGMAERPDSSSLLPTIAVPTLVVAGIEDEIVPEAEARDMAAHIPGARFIAIPSASHVSNLEQSEAFNTAVREFLASL